MCINQFLFLMGKHFGLIVEQNYEPKYGKQISIYCMYSTMYRRMYIMNKSLYIIYAFVIQTNLAAHK